VIGTESGQHDLVIGAQVAGFGRDGVRAGQLACHVGQGGQAADRRSPGAVFVVLAGADGRSAQVVEHDRQFWYGPGRGNRSGQLVWQRHDVKAQPGRRQRLQPAEHRRPGQPARIRLSQDRVPDTAQELRARQFSQAGHRVGDRRGTQVRPAHYARQQPARRGGQRAVGLGRLGVFVRSLVRVAARCQREQIRGLPRFGDRLDDHGAGYPGRCRQRGEIGERERPAQPGQLVVAGPRLPAHEPAMLPGGKIPHMVVRVDHPRMVEPATELRA